jgi:hypothetical protein
MYQTLIAPEPYQEISFRLAGYATAGSAPLIRSNGVHQTLLSKSLVTFPLLIRLSQNASVWVNPPFGSIIHRGRKKGPTAWVRKAIVEQQKGKLVCLVYPVDKWVLMILSAIGTKVRNLGDVRWCATEDGSPGKGTGRHVACFILEPKVTS